MTDYTLFSIIYILIGFCSWIGAAIADQENDKAVFIGIFWPIALLVCLFAKVYRV